MSIPVDYSMCNQTVTVYRKAENEIIRQELSGCFLQWREEVDYDQSGRWQERKFLLIQPGAAQAVYPGDRVFEGIGPEISPEAWRDFLPAKVPKLGEAAYATAYYWQGDFCHTEAGRK